MKKVFFFAATMLLMGVATSCSNGKCACYGNSQNIDGGAIDIKKEAVQGGYTDQMVCDDLAAQIKAEYPKAGYNCAPGKTLNDVLPQ